MSQLPKPQMNKCPHCNKFLLSLKGLEFCYYCGGRVKLDKRLILQRLKINLAQKQDEIQKLEKEIKELENERIN